MSRALRRGLALALALCLCLAAASALALERPVRLRLSHIDRVICVGESFSLEASALPAGADPKVSWRTNKPSVAAVSKAGVVLGKKAGVALIRAESVANPLARATVKITVKALPKPKKIVLSPKVNTLSLGEPVQFLAEVLPEGASAQVAWSSSSAKVATVSSGGLVIPRKEGTVKITARSKAQKTVYARLSLKVVDPLKPVSLKIEAEADYLCVGETARLSVQALPETAEKRVSWSSSDDRVVSVEASGLCTARAPGKAVITAKAARGKAFAKITLTVLDAERTQRVPARATPIAAGAIKANLALIGDVQGSALSELDLLLAKGQITKGEHARRSKMVKNAFVMAKFPWTTPKRVKYWVNNSAKDFRPGQVYYGLPYTQTGPDNRYLNRRYNVSKAVSGGYFAKTGKGYYRMTSRRLGGGYVGNDCSSFVSMATWLGVSNSACFLTTSDMAKSSYYATVSGYDNLRPGDALVWGGVHTVMFLYYVDEAKRRMMIVEQGGGSDTGEMHNTITCSVVNRSSYTAKYKIRRAKDLARN